MFNDYENMQEVIDTSQEDYTLGLRSAQGWELVSVYHKPYDNPYDMVQYYWKRIKLYSSDYNMSQIRYKNESEYLKRFKKIKE